MSNDWYILLIHLIKLRLNLWLRPLKLNFGFGQFFDFIVDSMIHSSSTSSSTISSNVVKVVGTCNDIIDSKDVNVGETSFIGMICIYFLIPHAIRYFFITFHYTLNMPCGKSLLSLVSPARDIVGHQSLNSLLSTLSSLLSTINIASKFKSCILWNINNDVHKS